ncbi:hypothetical protein EYF80_006470 [Liparis tanakae]|uniref:Uncharacterized protein n=1 Tax=Liparis tanakae TaxID=230148 RepID=A0A4Z2IZQ0_9TELE|nr:hypothetical protein EYF80_006470 [Liparis tanakae]
MEKQMGAAALTYLGVGTSVLVELVEKPRGEDEDEERTRMRRGEEKRREERKPRKNILDPREGREERAHFVH